MVRIAHLADTHLGHRQYNLEEREKDIYDVLEEIGEKIIEEHADIVIHSGDLFDSPRPTTQAYYAFKRLLKRLDGKVRFLAVLGDHDKPKIRGMPPHMLFEDQIQVLGAGGTAEHQSLTVDGKEVLVAGISNLSQMYRAVLAEELKKLGNQIDHLEESYMKFESAKRELATLEPREPVMAELKPVNESLEGLLRLIKDSVASLGYEPEDPSVELEALRKKKQEYDQNILIARRKAEHEQRVTTTKGALASKERELTKTLEAINKLGYSEEEHSEKQHEFDTETISLSNLEREITGMTEKKKTHDDEVANCDRKLKGLEKKESEKRLVDDFIVLLNKIRTAYGKDGVQKMIRARARPLLERSTRDLFERFNLAYSDIKIDDDYGIAVIGSSGEQQIEQISGGERVALAIALRLAIAQVLSGRVETIIMDEPTTHLDEERRKDLVNILSSFFREGGRIIPQMLIVTHHPEIVDVADVIYMIKKQYDYSIAESGSRVRDSG